MLTFCRTSSNFTRASLLTLFLGACHIATAQHIIPFEKLIESFDPGGLVENGEPVGIKYSSDLLLKEVANDGEESTLVPIAGTDTGQGILLLCYDIGQTTLRITLSSEGLKNDRFTFDVARAEGFSGSTFRDEKLNFRRDKDYINFPVVNSGRGLVNFSLKDIPGNREDYNFLETGYSITFFILSLKEEAAQLPAINPQNPKVALTRRAQLYDQFKPMVDGPSAKSWMSTQEGQRALEELRRIKDEIDSWHTRLAANADKSAEGLNLYYQTFASLDYSLTSTYRDAAVEKMKLRDQTAWNELAPGGILEAESYLNGFCDQVAAAGYDCAFRSQANNRISSLLDAWHSNPEQEDYCEMWEIIKESDYYALHGDEERFEAAKTKCDEGTPPPITCTRWIQRVRYRYGRNLLNEEYLNFVEEELAGMDCESQEGKEDILYEISIFRNRLDCKKLRNDLASEANPQIQRELALQILDNACEDEEIIAFANNILQMTEALQLRREGPVEKEEGGIYFQEYRVIVEKGHGVRLISINDITDSTKFNDLPYLEYEQSGEDSQFLFKVKDANNETEHVLVFQSVSGEQETITLTARQLDLAYYSTDTDYIIFEFKNSTPPYYVEITQGGKTYFATLNSDRDAIYKGDIPPGYKGVFQVVIRDRFGGRIEDKTVNLSQPNKTDLWMILALPMLAISGFLIYRNKDSA